MVTDEKFRKIQNKYHSLYNKWREDVIANEERAKSERDSRFDLMLQLRDMTEHRDALQENFDKLLKYVDNLKKGTKV